ncbi:MAG: hypothetical protein HOP09_14465 [Hyphomicrobium sp.]|nr:hypothetical protein [Hyphomicrobium sp.]
MTPEQIAQRVRLIAAPQLEQIERSIEKGMSMPDGSVVLTLFVKLDREEMGETDSVLLTMDTNDGLAQTIMSMLAILAPPPASKATDVEI